MTDPTETWLPLKTAAANYGLDYFQLHKWYRRGHVRGRKVHGQIEIARAALEDYLPPSGWNWLAASSRQYGISNTILYDLVQQGQLPARKRGGRWQVDLAALEQVLAERAIPAGWLTTAEAGRRLGVTSQEVLRRIRVGQLSARAHGRQMLVAEEEIRELAIPPGWLTTRQLAEKAQVCPGTVYGWIAKGWVQARKVHGRWIVEDRVPEQRRHPRQQTQAKRAAHPASPRRRRPSAPAGELPGDKHGYLPLQEAAGRYGLAYDQLYKLLQHGHVRRLNAGRHVLVKVASLEDWLPPPGWAWLFAAAEEYGISDARGRELIRQGLVPARKRGRRWQVERAGMEGALAHHGISTGDREADPSEAG